MVVVHLQLFVVLPQLVVLLQQLVVLVPQVAVVLPEVVVVHPEVVVLLPEVVVVLPEVLEVLPQNLLKIDLVASRSQVFNFDSQVVEHDIHENDLLLDHLGFFGLRNEVDIENLVEG